MISIAVVSMTKRMPYLFVGWLWYAITLLPVIKLLQVGNDAMADHYHYLASIGIAVMLAWGIPFLIKSEKTRKKVLFPAVITALTILVFLSWQQCGYWRDSITIFSHAVQTTKDNYLAHTNLANALAEKKNFNKAIYHYNKSIQIDPYIPINYENRGKAYAGLDNHRLAIDDFNKVIFSNPDYANAYYYRGISFDKIGQYHRAIDDFNKVISLKPDNFRAYNGRGILHIKLSLYQLATDDFNEAIRLKPDYADAYNNRAFIFLLQGNKNLGCSDAKKACALGNCKLLENAKGSNNCR
jgi:tetratricopeptide (TPR) repeat protein